MVFSKVINLFRKNASNAATETHSIKSVSQAIYGAVVAQARNPTIYTKYSIPDTVMGRYDMLALHVFLINYRLKYVEPEMQDTCAALSQKVFDLFVTDIERGLRDIGFADASVNKRKKKLVHSYYALIAEFDVPLQERAIDRLEPLVKARYFDEVEESASQSSSKKFARYLQSTAQHLSAQGDEQFVSAKFDWGTNEREKA